MARILVVEDDPVTRTLLTAQLRAGGHVVLASETGESATAIIGKLGCPDVMIVDVDLPGMDGPTALAQVRDELCPFPVGGVVLSVGPTPATRYLDAEQDAHLTKPVIADELLHAVDQVSPKRAQVPTATSPTAAGLPRPALTEESGATLAGS